MPQKALLRCVVGTCLEAGEGSSYRDRVVVLLAADSREKLPEAQHLAADCREKTLLQSLVECCRERHLVLPLADSRGKTRYLQVNCRGRMVGSVLSEADYPDTAVMVPVPADPLEDSRGQSVLVPEQTD